MENRENETFNYSYSAKEQEEIKAIRRKYAVEEQSEDKMTQLRRLDAGVTKKAATVSLVFGIIGTLFFGAGMSLAMTEIGEKIGLHGGMAMSIGSAVGVIGIVSICAAYPIYDRIIKREREKIAHEIIRLTDELMK